jgi:D-serine deaminase-like pyridoxal phosphate-dependent protein
MADMEWYLVENIDEIPSPALLAYPFVGPNVGRFIQLIRAYPATQFAAIADSEDRQSYPDLDFLCAAAVLTRVISEPGPGRLCFDLGTKAIASEKPHPRVRIKGLNVGQVLTHNEEHLVFECPDADRRRIGDCFSGVPYHVCPTAALYEETHVIEHHRFTECWLVTARSRRLTL